MRHAPPSTPQAPRTAPPPAPTAACPRCGRALPPLGTLLFPGHRSALYQCESCLRMVELDGGGRAPAPLTFFVDRDGVCRDPVDPAADLRDETQG